jgi:uncharacterized protein YjdB
MKKLLFSVFIAASLLSCSNNNDDDQSTISAEKKDQVFLRNTNGSIIDEMPTVVFQKIISNLKEDNQNKKVEALLSEYEDNNGTTKLTSSNTSLKTTAKSAVEPTFSYRAHVEGTYEEGFSWMNWFPVGNPVGTTGQGRRLEALEFTNPSYINGFWANAHIQGLGWTGQITLGNTVGTTGQKRRMEAIQIYVPESFAEQVIYRVYVQNIGWMAPVNNGQIAGTTGQSLRVESFQMWMVIIE